MNLWEPLSTKTYLPPSILFFLSVPLKILPYIENNLNLSTMCSTNKILTKLKYLIKIKKDYGTKAFETGLKTILF